MGLARPEPSQGTFGISPIVLDKQACPWRLQTCFRTCPPATCAWTCRGVRGEPRAWRQGLRFKVWPCPSSAVWPQASHTPFLSLSFLAGQVEMTVPASCGCYEDK